MLRNRYFVVFRNPAASLPYLDWGIDGSTSHASATCYKPHGQTLETRLGMEVGATRVLDVNGRLVSVKRLENEEDDKSFLVIL